MRKYSLVLLILTLGYSNLNLNAQNLMDLIKQQSISGIDRLIKNGVFINNIDNKGDSPLIVAIKTGNKKIVELLISNGADVNLCDKTGNYPLHYAIDMEKEEITDLLLTKGANVNNRNFKGDSPLHIAVKTGNIKIIKMLFMYIDLEMNAKNNEGETPLSFSNNHGKTNVADLLKSYGAKEELASENIQNVNSHQEIDNSKESSSVITNSETNEEENTRDDTLKSLQTNNTAFWDAYNSIGNDKVKLKFKDSVSRNSSEKSYHSDMAYNPQSNSTTSSQLNFPLQIDTNKRGGGDPLRGLNVSKTKEINSGTYYALIIGVDNYTGTWHPLKNAVNDAQAFENNLKTRYKMDYFITLYNYQATRSGILKAFEKLIDNLKEDDNLVIYYSGHGEYKKTTTKGYWVPVDAITNSISDLISNNDIQTFLASIQTKHTLLISDACFSGDIFRGNTISVPFEESDKYYSKVYNLQSRQALTSGGVETVLDGGKDGHSVFAYYLLKNLENNSNKYFDTGQLYNNLRIPVVNNSEQTPQLEHIKNTGDEGGQFIFIKK